MLSRNPVQIHRGLLMTAFRMVLKHVKTLAGLAVSLFVISECAQKILSKRPKAKSAV